MPAPPEELPAWGLLLDVKRDGAPSKKASNTPPEGRDMQKMLSTHV